MPAVINLGARLNTVPGMCPRCRTSTDYDVHATGVRWRCCGHVYVLPKLHPGENSADTCDRCRLGGEGK